MVTKLTGPWQSHSCCRSEHWSEESVANTPLQRRLLFHLGLCKWVSREQLISWLAPEMKWILRSLNDCHLLASKQDTGGGKVGMGLARAPGDSHLQHPSSAFFFSAVSQTKLPTVFPWNNGNLLLGKKCQCKACLALLSPKRCLAPASLYFLIFHKLFLWLVFIFLLWEGKK